MYTTAINNQIIADVNYDVSLILSGKSKPIRNTSGIRSFTHGEIKILRAYESRARNIQNAINKSSELLSFKKNEQAILVNELTKDTQQFNNAQQEDQKSLVEVNDHLERLGGTTAEYHTDAVVPPKMNNKTKANGYSFLLSCLIIEVVIFITTFSFQQETMSTNEIWMRGVYCLGQYIFTSMCFYKYTKTQLKPVKIMLSLSIATCFITLLHVICISFFINDDITATSSMGFDLHQLEAIQVKENLGLFARLLQTPGLLEFIVTAGIMFVMEIVCIDNRKIELAPENTTVSNAISCDNGEWLRLHHISILKDKQRKITNRINDRTIWYKEHIVDEIDKKNNDIKKGIELEQSNLDKYLQERETIIDECVLELNRYDDLMANETSFRINVDVSSITYEIVTRADVKNYLNL